MDDPSRSPPHGDTLPSTNAAVGTGPLVPRHREEDVSVPPSIDMCGLKSALGEDLDVESVQTKSPISDTGPGHGSLEWETKRVWLGAEIGWTSVRWTVQHNQLFARVGPTAIEAAPASTRPDTQILQLTSAGSINANDEASSNAVTSKASSKPSSPAPTPRYAFVDRARDQVIKSATWEGGIKDERMSQGVADFRNLLVQRPELAEACGRTTGNKWILGKAQPLVAESHHVAPDRNEVYVVVDRKEASLVDADYDLRWFSKTHATALASI